MNCLSQIFLTLGIVFIVLKLAGVIYWSWWWILAPFWIPFVILMLIFMLTGLIEKL